MEINITRFFNEDSHFDYAHSVAEGGPAAGRDTWAAAKERAAEEPHLLTSDEARERWRQDLQSMGFGSEEEVTSDPLELEGLLIQFISGDIREMQALCGDDWAAYETLAHEGTVSGRLFLGVDDDVYFSLGE